MRNPPPFFLHSEVLAFFRDPMTLPVLLNRTSKYKYQYLIYFSANLISPSIPKVSIKLPIFQFKIL